MLSKNSFAIARKKQALASLCLCEAVSPGLLGLLPTCYENLQVSWSLMPDVSRYDVEF